MQGARSRRSLVVLTLLVSGTASLVVGAVLVSTTLAQPRAAAGAPVVTEPAAIAGVPVGVPVGGVPVGGVPVGSRGQRAAGALVTPAPIPTGGRALSVRQPLPAEVRVVIPAIGVDAPVVALGLNRDGTLEVPLDFSQAGWWSGGPLPGDVGAAVVVGHVSSVAGPAVFARLGSLVAGDVVVVRRPDGVSVTFRVTRRLEVAKRLFPTRLVYGEVAGRELRLVTCGGAFDSSTGHFVDNVIVFASFAGASP